MYFKIDKVQIFQGRIKVLLFYFISYYKRYLILFIFSQCMLRKVEFSRMEWFDYCCFWVRVMMFIQILWEIFFFISELRFIIFDVISFQCKVQRVYFNYQCEFFGIFSIQDMVKLMNLYFLRFNVLLQFCFVCLYYIVINEVDFIIFYYN